MMKSLIIFFITCFLCVSCGVKDEPKYQTKIDYNKNINIV